MQLFKTPGHSFLRCPGTKGQAKNLAKGRDGPGQPKFRTGQAGTAKVRDRTRDKMGQTEKDVLEQEKDVLKQKRTF